MMGNGLEQQLRNFLLSLHEQGILDHNFENVRRSQTQGDPQILTEVVTMFINDVNVSMAETTRLMNESDLDYETLNIYLHQIQGRSASIGGCGMAAACRNIRQAIDARDKARCLETFEQVKEEYQTLGNAFHNILRGILDHNFENVRKSQTQGDPQLLIEVVTMVINDVNVSMAETTGLMNEPKLDYETFNSYLHQLQGRSARCLETLGQVKQEYPNSPQRL